MNLLTTVRKSNFSTLDCSIYRGEVIDAYVREYFQPSGQEGYAPTFRRISIYKNKNELTFEDIDE
jgi:hypothetical protein